MADDLYIVLWIETLIVFFKLLFLDSLGVIIKVFVFWTV